jgi:endonuclease YncB( thermonuclease family)
MKYLICILMTFTQASFAKNEVCRFLQKEKTIKAQLVKVLDGDTLRARVSLNNKDIEFRLRLVGIDTPESSFRGLSQGLWADEATLFVERKIPLDSEIEITHSGEACDRFYRVLGIVKYKNTNINKELVARGLAVAYCFDRKTNFCFEIARTMEQAMQKARGFHADSNFEYPYNFRARIAGLSETPYVSDLRSGNKMSFDEKEAIPAPWRLFLSK